MKRLLLAALGILIVLTTLLAPAFSKLNFMQLSAEEQKQVDSILTKTEAKLAAMKSRNTNPNWLELSALRSGLSWKEKLLIGKILRLKPSDLNVKTPRQSEEQMVKVAYQEIKDQPVMQNGKVVEQNTSDAIYSDPQTDYTRRLLSAIPGGLAAVA